MESLQIIENKLIAECTAYDFKSALERKKVRDWLKSVSAFANGEGGSLFFGVNNEGAIIGLENIQSDAEFISKCIKDRVDPVPEFELIPYTTIKGCIIEVKVKGGDMTPYFYYSDGTRIAYVRQGEESCTANSQQLLALILKGKHSSFDALKTDIKRGELSFVILANTFKARTNQLFEDKLLESFGLVSRDGYYTNAGLLFADNCPVYQSRLICTRWNGINKDDAIHDVEYKGNLIMLLNYGCEFIKTFTFHGWKKEPDRRKNLPDYSDRAVLEAVVNHLIHRDYTIIGSEVHIDIFDDRLEIYSPGGMVDGSFIQDRDIEKIPSNRRNPVIADVFAQLDYMEKRGSGLRKIKTETALIPNYTIDKAPYFRSTKMEFYTVLQNVNYRLDSIDSAKETLSITPEVHQKYTRSIPELSKIQRRVLDQIIMDPYSTRDYIAGQLSISPRTVSNIINQLKKMRVIERIGYTKGGRWEVNFEIH